MNHLFEKLNNSAIPYIVWKDITNVEVFLDGNNELDLLISSSYKDSFEALIHECGFNKLRLNKDFRKMVFVITSDIGMVSIIIFMCILDLLRETTT